MVTIECRLLVDQSGSGVIHVHENRSACVVLARDQRPQIRVVRLALHHGVVDVRAGDVDPTHHVLVDLCKGIEVDGGHTRTVRFRVLDGLGVQRVVELRGLLVADLRMDEQTTGHEQQHDADGDENV